MRGIPVRYYGIGNALTVVKGKSKKRKDCEKGVCYFGRGVLYFFGKTLKDNGVELEMNGNTADLHRMPPEGGGGTVYPDSICALRIAQHSYNTVLLDRSSEDCCRRKTSFAVRGSAGHKANKADKTDKTDDGAAPPSANACLRLILLIRPIWSPHSSYSSYIPAPGGFFVPGTGCILSPQIPITFHSERRTKYGLL